MIQKLLKVMHNPKVIFSAIIAGVVIGITSKDLAHQMAPVGQLFMSLLQMSIIPLLVVAIGSSLGNLLKNQEAKRSLAQIVVIFVVGQFLAAGLGLGTGLIGDVGLNLSEDAQASIGKMIAEADQSPLIDQGSDSERGLFALVKSMIPANIFVAFMEGHNLGILFFSILLGLSLGKTETPSAKTALVVFEGLYAAFVKMINGIMILLPIGLMCLFADHISHLGPSIFLALGPFLLMAFGTATLVVLISLVFISKIVNKSFSETLMDLRELSLVAIATSSSFASIPLMLDTMENKFKMNRQKTHLMVPLSVCLNPVASALFVSMLMVFLSQVYGIPIGASNALVILIGSVLTGIAMSGAPGIGALAMLSIVTAPLGIPVEPAIVLGLAAMPALESILTLANVLSNLCVSCLIAGEGVQQDVTLEDIQSEARQLLMTTTSADVEPLVNYEY
ncbi:MAG: hypothetical protein CL675_06840 [Bdellovibrionaceae bacterium]|nr:hypothetical protein [Pseudobdellovibrionaceae bacterium]